MLAGIACKLLNCSGVLSRYKHEIRAEDKVALQKLMKRQYHYLVTPEVHRELEASR